MQVYPPSVIVRILAGPFFRERGFAPAPRGLAPDEPPPAFDDDRVVSDMEQFGYVRLDAVSARPRGARDWVVVLVLHAAGKFSRHLPDLRRLLEGVALERPAREGRLDEVIVVAEDDFFGRKNLVEAIREAQKPQLAAARAAREEGGAHDPGGAAPFYSAYHYRNFALVVPEHKAVARHRVMGAAEVAELLQRYHQSRADLEVIYATDPPIVWNGGRPGQVVEILRDSLTAGFAISYRRIEHDPL